MWPFNSVLWVIKRIIMIIYIKALSKMYLPAEILANLLDIIPLLFLNGSKKCMVVRSGS